MIKLLKKIVLCVVSILGISVLCWVLFLLNPSLSYANTTQFDIITVYHNQDLDESTGKILNDVIRIIKQSDLFTDETQLSLCMNDDKIYPHLNPMAGQCLGYALFNNAVFKNGTVQFKENRITTQWEINNNELRKFNLTWLLAHEFTHCLQFQENSNYVIKSTLGHINWKLEGHAEYVSKEFETDGELKNKIKTYQIESQNKFTGFPVFDLEDNTKQILSYYKYALVIQYLFEEKDLNYQQICALETDLDTLYEEMIQWSEKEE